MKIKITALFLTFIMLMLPVGCSDSTSDENNGNNIIYITKENYDAEVLKSDKTVLLDFYADWCGPCKMLAPILEEIAGERSDIIIGKINVDEEAELSSLFAIEAMPTMVIMKNGKEVRRAVGYREKNDILSMLE